MKIKYTKEQIKPKRYPNKKPTGKGHYWTIHKSDRCIYKWYFNDSYHHWRCIDWFIDVLGAPNELKPVAYPENKPKENGSFIAHFKEYDSWDSWIYADGSELIKSAWDENVDWFISYNLAKKEKAIEVMYDRLIDHIGHHIVITYYKEIDEVAVECEDCCEVLLAYRKEGDEDDNE